VLESRGGAPRPLTPGTVEELASGIRRVVAPNPGMMTGAGTNAYLIGRERVCVIDPGPADPAHVQTLLSAAEGSISWIAVTHTHLDHSPAARLLAERTGAELLGRPPPDAPRHDGTFAPTRMLADGDRLATGEFTLVALATPGHASNHLCYLHEKQRWLFTGDHLIDGSTVVIDPPDGDMQDYLSSLRRLAQLPLEKIAPGHGRLLDEPLAAIESTIAHRAWRESRVVEALCTLGTATLEDLLERVYVDVGTALRPVAARSLLAHLLKLEREGRAHSAAGHWRIAEASA
jgi:glyoxylase-like metal-dependent hydrolase (beta-lactamase superfamily II)